MAAGLEIFFGSIQGEIKDQSDTLVCLLHWSLVSEGLKCAGLGETAPPAGCKTSEKLPSGWNGTPGSYALLYRPSKGSEVTTLLLKVITMDTQLLVHLMQLNDEKMANIAINIGDYASEDLCSFESAFKNVEELHKKFKKEVLDAIKMNSKPSGSSTSQRLRDDSQPQQQPQQSRHGDEDDPLRVGHPQRGGGMHGYTPEWADPWDPFAVGRGDLDPLAAGRGGGMYMDPFRRGGPGFGGGLGPGMPGRLPHGAVPPGARFDPFGPANPDAIHPGRGGAGAGPDPDHMRPPDYDDMFS